MYSLCTVARQPLILGAVANVVAACTLPVVLVPCRAISSIETDGWDYAIHITGAE
jgi:hypothetical protein